MTWQRIRQRYREQGLPGLAAGAARRWRRWSQADRPPLWARLGLISEAIAWSVPLCQPPVLVLSLPRSGSSWVGDVLGSARNAAYLREPLNQTHLALEPGESVFPFNAQQPPPGYRSAAARAFAGLPHFPAHPSGVLKHREQWSLAQRRRRRLVVKEVNPHLAEWLISAYAPRIVFLLRHPAAIALSYRKLGWWSADDPWYRSGVRYSQALHAAWHSLQGYAATRLVFYEQLCLEPIGTLVTLFDFAGLTWEPAIEQRIRRQSTSQGDGTPYSLIRESRLMPNSWRGQIAPADLAALRSGYSECSLPWYQSPEDW